MLPSKESQAPTAEICLLQEVTKAGCAHMQGHSQGFQAVIRALIQQRQRGGGHPEVKFRIFPVCCWLAQPSLRVLPPDSSCSTLSGSAGRRIPVTNSQCVIFYDGGRSSQASSTGNQGRGCSQ